METIKTADGVVTVYIDRDDFNGPAIDLSLFVRGQGFQCMLDKTAALEMVETIKTLLEDS